MGTPIEQATAVTTCSVPRPRPHAHVSCHMLYPCFSYRQFLLLLASCFTFICRDSSLTNNAPIVAVPFMLSLWPCFFCKKPKLSLKTSQESEERQKKHVPFTGEGIPGRVGRGGGGFMRGSAV